MNKVKSIYLLYGEEKFLLEKELIKMKKQFGEKINGINYIQLDSSNIQTIIDNISTPAFGYNKKLIVARNTNLFKKISKTKKNINNDNQNNNLVADIVQYIENNIEMINSSIFLIFVEDEDVEKNQLYKVIERMGIIREFKKLKPFEAKSQIKEICNLYKVNIEESTLNYFIELCGSDMQELINEVRKQIEFVGPNGTIDKSTIDLLAIKKIDSVIFDLTDNFGQKNINKTLEVLNELLYEKEPIQKIIITLYNHIKKIYFTKIAINNRLNIAETLNLKSNQMFLVQKYSMQSKYFSEKELISILKDMIELDYRYKMGKIDEYVGLETILCNYCS